MECAVWKMPMKLLRIKMYLWNFPTSFAFQLTNNKIQSNLDDVDIGIYSKRKWVKRFAWKVSLYDEDFTTYIPLLTNAWFCFFDNCIMWLKLSPHVIIARDLMDCPSITKKIPIIDIILLFMLGKKMKRIMYSINDTYISIEIRLDYVWSQVVEKRVFITYQHCNGIWSTMIYHKRSSSHHSRIVQSRHEEFQKMKYT